MLDQNPRGNLRFSREKVAEKCVLLATFSPEKMHFFQEKNPDFCLPISGEKARGKCIFLATFSPEIVRFAIFPGGKIWILRPPGEKQILTPQKSKFGPDFDISGGSKSGQIGQKSGPAATPASRLAGGRLLAAGADS